jgi:hypothetical protein
MLAALAPALLGTPWDRPAQGSPPIPTTDAGSPASSSGAPVVKDRGAELVEPPKRQGQYTRYWISANYNGQDVLGFAAPGGARWKWAQKEASGAEADSIRQFRLRDGRHALAIYDDGFYYSLVLIYKVPAPGVRVRVRAAVQTRDGSLEAWLLRHEGHEHSEAFLPLKQWRHFLGASAEERARQAKTCRLEGAAKVTEDEFGLLAKMDDLNLRTAQPLPPFTEYLDFEEKSAKGFLHELKMREVPAERSEFEPFESQLQSIAFWRKNKTSDCARIQGWVMAGWAPPLRKIYFP